jgi:hypothetical protein
LNEVGQNWIGPAIDPRHDDVPNVVDLSLCVAARSTLRAVLADRGLGFFLVRRGRGPGRLDNRRIAWVVEAARRRARPGCDGDDLARTRRVVRRELIRRLADAMVATGL